jgi:hypothetical protein
LPTGYDQQIKALTHDSRGTRLTTSNGDIRNPDERNGEAMHPAHIGLARNIVCFFLNGQMTHPISFLEGDRASALIFLTSLLDFAGPCARLFSLQITLPPQPCPR